MVGLVNPEPITRLADHQQSRFVEKSRLGIGYRAGFEGGRWVGRQAGKRLLSAGGLSSGWFKGGLTVGVIGDAQSPGSTFDLVNLERLVHSTPEIVITNRYEPSKPLPLPTIRLPDPQATLYAVADITAWGY